MQIADRKTALKEVAEDLISGEVWLGAISGEQYKSRNWVFFRARLDRADLDEVGRRLAPPSDSGLPGMPLSTVDWSSGPERLQRRGR